MKLISKLAQAVVIILALNFVGLAIAGGVLAQKLELNGEKWSRVKAVLLEEPEEIVEEPEPEPLPPTPMEQLVMMLDEQSGKPAESRVESMNLELDERLVETSRREREVTDRELTVQAAMKKLAGDRASFEQQKQAWQLALTEVRDREADEGFQSALSLYESMQAKQVKAIFAGMEDEVVLSFLRAMEARQASKILKEFKTPAETERATRIMEKLREGEAAAIAEAAVRNGAAGDAPPLTPPGPATAADGTDPFADANP